MVSEEKSNAWMLLAASLQNLERRRLLWSHRFVCDMLSKEKRKSKVLMTASLMILESLLV